MKKIPTPHDRLVRASMSHPQVAVDFFTFHLPASVQQAINFDTLKLEKETFVDEELRLALADMLFSVQIANRPGYLYLLVEHQSTPDKLMALSK